MDPSAPNNNKQSFSSNNPKDPNSEQPQSPIQPGQFAVAGGDAVFKEPPAPAGAGQNTPQEPPLTTPPATGNQPQPTSAPPLSPEPQPVTSPPPAEPATAQTFSESQPNPTPYVPPGTQEPPENSSPSGIKKMRMVIIIVGVLLLVVLIGALVWFFVLSKNRQSLSSNKNQNPDATVEAPSPPPLRTSGGFSEIPPATGGASQATPGATSQ